MKASVELQENNIGFNSYSIMTYRKEGSTCGIPYDPTNSEKNYEYPF